MNIRDLKAIPSGLLTPISYEAEKMLRIDVNLDTFDDVFTNNIHVAIAHSIVRKIASNPKSRSMSACLDIVNCGYNQHIFEDICQEIAETLIQWNIDNIVKIKDNKLDFATYENKKGDIVSYYGKLFGIVEKTLYSYSNHNQNDGKIVSLDAIYTNDDGDNQKAVTTKNPSYARLTAYNGGLDDVIKRTDFQAFIKYASTSKFLSATTIKSFMMVLYGLLDGLKLEEIAQRYNLGIATVKRRRADIKDVYTAWIKDGGKIDINSHDVIFYGCASMPNNGTIATNNGYFDGVYTSPIYPIINDVIPMYKTDNDGDDIKYNSDSKVYIKDCGKVYQVYYRSEIDGDDGEKIHNDVFIHEIEKH